MIGQVWPSSRAAVNVDRAGVGDDGPVAKGTIATFDHRDLPLDLLVDCKRGTAVSVCIPARDEAATIARIVDCIRRELVESAGLVDELIVVDDGSTDATAALARGAGARVVPVVAAQHGKGEAMARGAAEAIGDVVVFLDADVENFGPHFVAGLAGPLLLDRSLRLVKGAYARPVGGQPDGGGRVTELVARPVLSLLFPEIEGVRQPLAGETAVRRDVLDELTFAPGYGVELGLLVDVARTWGLPAIAQVDLGTRVHRNRPLHELAPQAREVLRAALDRAGVPVTR
jgi:glucosyl-3-phosphoglycerate synthase